jgi:deoxycytidylate deaminase
MDLTELHLGLTTIVKMKRDTNWYVLHAEANAILKVAKSTNSCQGALFILNTISL